MLFIYVLKMFANVHFLERTIFKMAEKRCWCCVRDTEFVPEFEVPSDVEIKGIKNNTQQHDRNEFYRLEHKNHFDHKQGKIL